MMTATRSQKTAENIANIIGTKLQFETEKEEGIIPIEFMGIVTDYNGVDINQTTDYIEMSSESYLKRLFKSHGWDKDIKFLSDFSDFLQNATDSDLDQLGIPATSVAEAINSLETISGSSPVSPFQDVMNVSKVKPTSDPSGNTPPSITVPESKKITSTGTKPLAPMPSDCIDKMYTEEGF